MAKKGEQIDEIGGGDFTIIGWIKALRKREQDQIIISRSGGGLSDFKLYVQKQFGLLRLYSPHMGDFGCGVVDNETWNHIAITYQNYSLCFYMNGLLFYNYSVPGGILPGKNHLQVGSFTDGSNALSGEIDQLRLVNRCLALKDITRDLLRDDHRNKNERRTSKIPPSPLYEDPLFNSAKDGTIVWNRYEGNWWFIYMQIRNGTLEPGVSIHHGTTIGAASSDDRGLTWQYRGFLNGLDEIPGSNTHWAPDFVWDEGKYHAFISKVRGKTNPHWEGDRVIMHYTSTNMLDWTLEGKLDRLSSVRCLDGTAFKMPDGKWGFWYKDEIANRTGFAEGDDLYNLRFKKFIDFSNEPLEGSDVFFWKNYYWLLGDDLYSYNGLRVYRSTDCINWERQPNNILNQPGTRPHDRTVGHHPEVVVDGDIAYLFYWVGETNDLTMNSCQICYLQITRLEYEDGELLCDRDKEFELILPQG